MKLLATITLLLAPLAASAQTPAPPTAMSNVTFTTKTTIVLVPALVRTKSGQLVYTLKASDFTLTDNGVEQKLFLEDDTDTQPLALVIAVETGAAGANEISKLENISPFLEALVGGVRHRVAVVSFDSTPQLQQNFTDKMDKISTAMKDLTPGDNRAAILDALGYSVDLLRKQPPEFRRAILLISETADQDSTLKLGQALRDITDTNTTIFSLAFPSPKNALKHGTAKALGSSKPGPPGGCMANDPDPDTDQPPNKAARAWACLGLLVPPIPIAQAAVIAAIDSFRRNIPETVAHLTGGEYYKVESLKVITRDLMTIANHVPNRYVLSFYPSAPTPGPHAINLHLPDHINLSVTARNTYWVDDDTAAPPQQ
jgi:VWFA-related protein